MSVLYKALQKAEKENEQRQSASGGKGFDPARLAGSGAIKLAGTRANMRLTAVAGLAVLVVTLGAAFLFVTPQLQEPQRQQVAKLTPTPVRPAPKASSAPPAGAPEATTPASSTVPQAATQTPPSPAANDTPPQSAAAQPATTPAPAPAVPQPATAQVADRPTPSAPQPATTQNAAQPAPAAPPQMATTQAAASPAAAAPAPAPNAASPKENANVAPPVAPAQPKETVVAKAAPPTPPTPVAMPSLQKPVEIAADSPAQALSPPISVARSTFALEGVGRAVQVREVSQEARDDAGAGYTALLRGEYDTALGFYDSALKKEPTSVLAMLGRGAALQKLRRLDEAQAEYAKVLKADPKNREALTNITAIIGDRAPAEALNRLLDLEKDYPGFSPVEAQIGLIYAKTGAMEPALDYLRRAVALSPQSVMYQYNLALVLDHMGLAEQAVQAYESVLSALAVGNGPPELSLQDIERRVRFLRVR